MSNSYLTVNDLNFEYPDGFKALHNINFQIKKNERIAVLGPNLSLIHISEPTRPS